MTRHFRIKKIFNGTTEHFIVQQRRWGFIWCTPEYAFKSIITDNSGWGDVCWSCTKFNTHEAALAGIQGVREVLVKRFLSYKRIVQSITITV